MYTVMGLMYTGGEVLFVFKIKLKETKRVVCGWLSFRVCGCFGIVLFSRTSSEMFEIWFRVVKLWFGGDHL